MIFVNRGAGLNPCILAEYLNEPSLKDFNIKIMSDIEYTLPSKAWVAPRLIVPGHGSDSRHCAVGGTKAQKIIKHVKGLCRLAGLIDIAPNDLNDALNFALFQTEFPVSVAKAPKTKKKPKIAFGDDPINTADIPKILPVAIAPRETKNIRLKYSRKPDRKLVVEHDINHLIIRENAQYLDTLMVDISERDTSYGPGDYAVYRALSSFL